MKNKIPLASEEIYRILDGETCGNWSFDCEHIRDSDKICEKMCNGFCEEFANIVKQLSNDKIEFAKLHVKAALKEALDSIPCLGSSTDIATYDEVEKEVLNAYPEELIK